MTKSRGILQPRKPWADTDLATLRTRYPNEKTTNIAQDLDRALDTVYRMAKKLGLAKTAEYLASPDAQRLRRGDEVGKAYRFPPGHVPANKGLKTPGFAPGRMGDTQFKRGGLPGNTMPIGSHKPDKDGTLLRKIREAPGNSSKRWRSVHELVWVEANGPVPPKHIVIFKPGMRTTTLEEITLDRVECISLAENMRRNTRHNLPKELSDLIALRAALNRQINKRSKNNEQ